MVSLKFFYLRVCRELGKGEMRGRGEESEMRRTDGLESMQIKLMNCRRSTRRASSYSRKLSLVRFSLGSSIGVGNETDEEFDRSGRSLIRLSPFTPLSTWTHSHMRWFARSSQVGTILSWTRRRHDNFLRTYILKPLPSFFPRIFDSSPILVLTIDITITPSTHPPITLFVYLPLRSFDSESLVAFSFRTL